MEIKYQTQSLWSSDWYLQEMKVAELRGLVLGLWVNVKALVRKLCWDNDAMDMFGFLQENLSLEISSGECREMICFYKFLINLI